MTKALAYARVSTTEQAQGMSIDSQLDRIREYSAQRGLKLVGEYVDRGATGTSDERPEFRRMLEVLLGPSNEIEAVVVLHTSRFMRDVELARRYKRELRRRGARVLAVQQEVSDDANGELMEGIYELFDQHESRIIGMRARAGMKENVRQGYFNGSVAPFGFKVVKVAGPNGKRQKSKLAPDDAECEVVRHIFDRYLAGAGVKTMARELNQRGTDYRGRRWNRDLVLGVLGNPAVAGTYEWGRKDSGKSEAPVTTKVVAIVSPAAFERAQTLREKRDPARSKGGGTHTTQLLGGGLLRCGKCGASYQLETSGKSPHYRYYNCRAFCRAGREACSGYRIATKTLDEAVLRHLADELFTEDRCRALLRDLTGSQSEIRREKAERRKALEEELAGVGSAIQRWCEAFESGTGLADLGTDRLRTLRDRQAELTQALQEARPPPALPPYLFKPAVVARFQERLRAALLGDDQQLARTYLSRLVESIEITDGDVLVRAKAAGVVELMAAKGAKDAAGLVSQTGRSKVRTHVVHWHARQDSNLRPVV